VGWRPFLPQHPVPLIVPAPSLLIYPLPETKVSMRNYKWSILNKVGKFRVLLLLVKVLKKWDKRALDSVKFKIGNI
jgi:hypothetical protein